MNRIWFGGEAEQVPTGWRHCPTTISVNDLSSLLGQADEVRLADPLAFPWDSIGDSVSAPITIDVDHLSLLDLAALSTCLRLLSPSDCIYATDPALARHLQQEFATAPPADTTPLEQRQDAKLLDRSRREIVSRLESEAELRGDRDRVIIATLPQEAVTAPEPKDFLEKARAALGTHGAGEIFEVWGLRVAPGTPTAGAVVAYRLNSPSEAAR